MVMDQVYKLPPRRDRLAGNIRQAFRDVCYWAGIMAASGCAVAGFIAFLWIFSPQ